MRLPCCLGLLAAIGCSSATSMVKLVAAGDEQTVWVRPPTGRPSSPTSTQILFLALDGVSRDLLYDLVRAGKLPNLGALLGGDHLAHAYLDESFLSNLPSTTMAAWVSMLTGKGAAETGVTGNEFFIRERRELACPAPVSFSDSAPTLAIYADGYLNQLVDVDVPSVYETIHQDDPDALIWVVMNHFFRGADKLLLAKRTVLASAFAGLVETELAKVAGETSRKVYQDLDEAAVDALVSRLRGTGTVPDVLTLYLSGTDLYAHVAQEGPDQARMTYLTAVVDPALGPLVAQLRARHALADRWVIVSSDHGHTQIVDDDRHAIGTGEDSAPGVLHRAGFRTRPFQRSVDPADPFSAVLAYGGAMAYVYLADRSTCPAATDVCRWSDPPRYQEDVLAAAEAFYSNDQDGALAAGMQGRLDMIFVRRPRPVAEIDEPFEVYVGGGKTMSIAAYLAAHPHPTYVAVAARLRELAVGRHGERAGDLLLLAHDGDRATPEERYYFAAPYRSWHGSPSKLDSEIPLIVAHRGHRTAEIRRFVRPILGARPFQRKITDLVLALRRHPPH